MNDVSIRDLRNHGAEVMARVGRGEALTVTRDGKPVAELTPVPRTPLAPEVLVSRWQHLPRLDGEALRADIDRVLDAAL